MRALMPHVGAYVELGDGKRLGVRRAAAAPGEGPLPGELSTRDGRLLYGAADGPLELHEVQPAGKRAMDASSYLRGHAVQPTGQRE